LNIKEDGKRTAAMPLQGTHTQTKRQNQRFCLVLCSELTEEV